MAERKLEYQAHCFFATRLRYFAAYPMRPIARLSLIAAVPILFGVPAPVMVKNRPLLRIKHEIISFGWKQNRILVVTQSGRVSLSVQRSAPFSAETSEHQQPNGMLHSAELQALRNLLASTPVQKLHDSYSASSSPTITSDGGESMTIEVNILEEQKRIVLPDLDSVGAHNSTVYPAPLHDVVCKIYGLEQRLGIPYGKTVMVDTDGRKSDDTLCETHSLELTPSPLPQ